MAAEELTGRLEVDPRTGLSSAELPRDPATRRGSLGAPETRIAILMVVRLNAIIGLVQEPKAS